MVAEYYQRCFGEELPRDRRRARRSSVCSAGGARHRRPQGRRDATRSTQRCPARTTRVEDVQARHRRRDARHRGADRACRSPSSPARPAWPASGRACRCRRARCRRPRWRELRGAADRWRCGCATTTKRCTPPRMPAARRRARSSTRSSRCASRPSAPAHGGRRRQSARRARRASAEAEGYDRMTRKDQLPLPDALGLLARERSDRRAGRPRSAQRVLDLWRDTLDEQADEALAEMASTAGRPGRLRPRRPQAADRDLDLARGRGRGRSPRTQDEDGEEGGETAGQQDQSGEGEAQARAGDQMLGAQPETMQGEAADEEAEETEDEGAGGRGRRQARRPAASAARCRRSTTPTRYHAFTDAVRRGRRGRRAVRRRRADPAARSSSTSSCSHLQGVVAKLANRLQRRLMAQQNRAWEFDLEEGMLDAARLARVVVNPMHAAVLQARAGDRVPRHRRHAADRQFRLDARPADHRRRDVRRHPGAHAGALRA